jgi:hypothetical protein
MKDKRNRHTSDIFKGKPIFKVRACAKPINKKNIVNRKLSKVRSLCDGFM